MGGRHHPTAGSSGGPVAHRHDVAQEAGGAPGVHDVCHAALEVRVAVVQDGNAQRADPMGNVGQLLACPPAHEAQVVNELELVVAQQVQRETAGLEHQVVAEVELVDVDGDAWYRGDDRCPHRAVQDHAVAFLTTPARSEEHTSELQSHVNLVCRLLLEKKKEHDHI